MKIKIKNIFPGYLRDTLKEFNRGCFRDDPFRITTNLIYCLNENPSIYYIMGTSTGKVGIFDIFFTEEMKLSPVLYIDAHKASIETLSIYENHYLIISSSDGMISFTDISPVKLRNAFKSVTTNIDNIDPNLMTSMKQYYGSIKKGVDKFNRFGDLNINLEDLDYKLKNKIELFGFKIWFKKREHTRIQKVNNVEKKSYLDYFITYGLENVSFNIIDKLVLTDHRALSLEFFEDKNIKLERMKELIEPYSIAQIKIY